MCFWLHWLEFFSLKILRLLISIRNYTFGIMNFFSNYVYFSTMSMTLVNFSYIYLLKLKLPSCCNLSFFNSWGRELLSNERKDLFWKFIDSWYHAEGDTNTYTAKGCLTRILKHGSSLLGESLASLYEFSLMLRSASPRLVLYRQLAEESLSSFPLVEEGNSEASENLEIKVSDSLLVGVNPKSPGGKCCWVDTGGALFFEIKELLLWLWNPSEG